MTIDNSLHILSNAKGKIATNEIFGPTIQGEGPDIGKACIFLRLHNCPVKCPGCDTHYTWDGSERGDLMTPRGVYDTLLPLLAKYPGAGLVLSGGEPLLGYKSEALLALITAVKQHTWVSLETSGFVSKREIESRSLFQFLSLFDSVSWSPKITPCLHGQHSDEDLLVNAQTIFHHFRWQPRGRCLKFVVRDQTYIDVVVAFKKFWSSAIDAPFPPVYLMPYGIEADEVAESCRNLVKPLAETGFTLSPRLHSLLWGKQRGV